MLLKISQAQDQDDCQVYAALYYLQSCTLQLFIIIWLAVSCCEPWQSPHERECCRRYQTESHCWNLNIHIWLDEIQCWSTDLPPYCCWWSDRIISIAFRRTALAFRVISSTADRDRQEEKYLQCGSIKLIISLAIISWYWQGFDGCRDNTNHGLQMRSTSLLRNSPDCLIHTTLTPG